MASQAAKVFSFRNVNGVLRNINMGDFQPIKLESGKWLSMLSRLSDSTSCGFPLSIRLRSSISFLFCFLIHTIFLGPKLSRLQFARLRRECLDAGVTDHPFVKTPWNHKPVAFKGQKYLVKQKKRYVAHH